MRIKAVSIIAAVLFLAILPAKVFANSDTSVATNLRWSDESYGYALFEATGNTISIEVYKDGVEVYREWTDKIERDSSGAFDLTPAINESGTYTFSVTIWNTKSETSPPLEYTRPSAAMEAPQHPHWQLGDADVPYPVWDWPDNTTRFEVVSITPSTMSENYFTGVTQHSIPDFYPDYTMVFKTLMTQYRIKTLSEDILSIANSVSVESPVYYYGSGEPYYDPSPGPESYEYEYDNGEGAYFPIEELDEIKTVEDAVKVLSDLKRFSDYYGIGVSQLERFAEEAIARAVTVEVSSQFAIDYDLLSGIEAQAIAAKEAVQNELDSWTNVDFDRDLRTVARFKISGNTAFTQPINSSILSLSPGRALAAAVAPSSVTINVNENYSNSKVDRVLVDTGGAVLYLDKGEVKTGAISVTNQSAGKAAVDFGSKSSIVTVAFPGQGGSFNPYTDYYTVLDSEGTNFGGIHDPGSGSFKAKIDKSGVFSVALNEKDFPDIKNEENSVQNAIKCLAAKGIINGRSPSEYVPGAKITRAEIATLLVLVLKRLDPNADGGFTDVKSSDWFFGAAGSSKNQSLISGYDDNTFRGGSVIPKSQIYAVSARMLTKEMGYKTPSDINGTLKDFKDAASIPDWAKSDIALAEYAGLVSKRVDKNFDSNEEMTRANAAPIIWRLYSRVW